MSKVREAFEQWYVDQWILQEADNIFNTTQFGFYTNTAVHEAFMAFKAGYELGYKS